MIGRRNEYEKMFQVETKLWWYRHLHERVLTEIERHFGTNRALKILDAGCGTGGLLWFLGERGYTRLQGIDGSTDAVGFCHDRGLTVELVDLTQLASHRPDDNDYDVIICNDVLYCLAEEHLLPLLHELGRRLHPEGLLITNNNAFRVFRGQHDLAVGALRRFVRADFDTLLPTAHLTLVRSTYWSFFLSPLILVVRQWQALQLRLHLSGPTPASDIDVPALWLNKWLYHLVSLEHRWLPRTPFGSSLFLVCQKNQA